MNECKYCHAPFKTMSNGGKISYLNGYYSYAAHWVPNHLQTWRHIKECRMCGRKLGD